VVVCISIKKNIRVPRADAKYFYGMDIQNVHLFLFECIHLIPYRITSSFYQVLFTIKMPHDPLSRIICNEDGAEALTPNPFSRRAIKGGIKTKNERSLSLSRKHEKKLRAECSSLNRGQIRLICQFLRIIRVNTYFEYAFLSFRASAVQTFFSLFLPASCLFSPSFPRLFAGERGSGGECSRLPELNRIFCLPR